MGHKQVDRQPGRHVSRKRGRYSAGQARKASMHAGTHVMHALIHNLMTCITYNDV